MHSYHYWCLISHKTAKIVAYFFPVNNLICCRFSNNFTISSKVLQGPLTELLRKAAVAVQCPLGECGCADKLLHRTVWKWMNVGREFMVKDWKTERTGRIRSYFICFDCSSSKWRQSYDCNVDCSDVFILKPLTTVEMNVFLVAVLIFSSENIEIQLKEK